MANDVQHLDSGVDNDKAQDLQAILDEYEDRLTKRTIAAIRRSFELMRADLAAASEDPESYGLDNLACDSPFNL